MKNLSRRDPSRSFLAAGIALLCIATSARAATAPPSIKAIASSTKVKIGAIVTVTVRINGARNVGSAPFTLLYDPAILEFVEATSIEGGFFKQRGAATSFVARTGPLSRGGGVVVGASRLDPVDGAAGKGALCRLTFRAIAPGLSQLTFTRATLLDPGAQPLGATFTGTSIRVRPAS